MNYDLIIFDCDGTLINSEPLSNKVVCEMMMEQGLEMTPQKAIQLFEGKSFKDIIAYLGAHLNKNLDFDFENEFRKRTRVLFKKELQPMPGVIEFIKNLPIPYCIASNGPHLKMETSLPAAGLDKYFDNSNTFSAYDVSSWKPAPLLFHYAAVAMGQEDGKILVIEDTLPGAMAAINANMDLRVYAPKNGKAFLDKKIETFNSYHMLRKELQF